MCAKAVILAIAIFPAFDTRILLGVFRLPSLLSETQVKINDHISPGLKIPLNGGEAPAKSAV